MDTWNNKYIFQYLHFSATRVARSAPLVSLRKLLTVILIHLVQTSASNSIWKVFLTGCDKLPLMNINNLHQRHLERLEVQRFQRLHSFNVARRHRWKTSRFVKRIWILGNAVVCHQRGYPLAYALVQRTYATVPRDWTPLESSWYWWVLW